MVVEGTEGKWREGMEMIGAKGMARDGGGGGPITVGVKDDIEGIEGMGGGPPIGAELIGGGGPRFKGGRGGMAAVLTEQMVAVANDAGPMGAGGFGNGGKRE